MKAEHRKELETNILADRMGRVVQRIKERPQKRTFLYVIGALILFFAVFFSYRVYRMGVVEDEERWLFMEQAIPKGILDERGAFLRVFRLAGVNPQEMLINIQNPVEGNAGKAARFQVGWYYLWENGIKKLGADSTGALVSLYNAEKIFLYLVDECKGDKDWSSEALYALAVIDETRAVQDRQHLDSAKKKYDEIVAEYPDTGYGKLAQQRSTRLEKHKDEVGMFYQNLQEKFRVIKKFDEKPQMP